MESQPAVLSFPHKRELRLSAKPCWMPAFAGMTGDSVG